MAKLAKSVVVALVLLASGPASAQLRGLPGAVGGALPDLPNVGLPNVGGVLQQPLQRLDPRDLAEARLQRLADLVRSDPRRLDTDRVGNPVVRGEILALSPSAEALVAAQRAGFAIAKRESLSDLGVDLVTLTSPPDVSASDAIRRLQRLDPAGHYDLDHLYFGAGAGAEPAAALVVMRSPVRIGLIDTGLDTRHEAVSDATVERKGFAGEYQPAPHGLAVASLTGVGRGGTVFSADVYGAAGAGGSAAAVVRALAWMVEVKAPVVNISLVGPANAAVQAAVAAVHRRGVLIVAPVGNDGPAAPAAFPASYPDVVAVTGVDRRGKVLLEAGRASHLDFAAPGADITAATPSGFGPVRGTSFAAPIVAGRLARLVQIGSRDPVADLANQAKQPGKLYGKGLVGTENFASR